MRVPGWCLMSRLDGWTRFWGKTIGLFSPQRGMSYMRGRMALASYAAASTSGPNQAWRPGNKSADQILGTDHKLMRARARALTRDSSHVSGAIRKICNNVVFKGIKPQADTGRDRQDDQAEAAYKRWADAVGFHEMENLVLRHWWHDGESFVNFYYDEDLAADGIIPVGIELLECDHLDVGKNSLTDGVRTKQGIEYNAKRKPTGYWLYPEHPGDNAWLALNGSQRFPAAAVNHLFIRERISQNRGIPWLASIIMEMRDFGEYQSAERIAKRLTAAFGLFVTVPYPEQLGNGVNPFGSNTPTVDDIPDYMESGKIQPLPPGMDIKSPDMDRPGQTYEPYTKTSLRGASTGFNMSYEAYSNDYTGASFASARSATLEERRGYQVQQYILASKFHHDAWQRLWIMNRLAQVEKGLPDVLPVTWQMPGWPWVDPLKDSKAAEIDLKNGLSSRRRICSERGMDYDDIQKDLNREKSDGYGNEE